jgi:hypothetical protein
VPPQMSIVMMCCQISGPGRVFQELSVFCAMRCLDTMFVVFLSQVCCILCPFLDIMYHLLVQFDRNINVARLTPLGEPPSPRAAHVATAVGTMVVIQVPSLAVSILLSDEC